MGLDLGEMHGWILAELRRRRSVGESVMALIEKCEAARPHPDWARLRRLAYDNLSELREWIRRPFQVEPPEAPLKGLWFGLFKSCPDGRTPVADIYVCGSRRFDPDPLDNQWAVRPDWWPDARYADSTLLANLYRIAYRQGDDRKQRAAALGNDADYPLCLGYGALAVRDLLEQTDPALVLGRSESLGVAVGFDSGDFVLLGQLDRSGLKPPKPGRSTTE